MIYYCFYNPESKELEVETIVDYHEIKRYSESRGFVGFKVVNHRSCVSKKATAKFNSWANVNRNRFIDRNGNYINK